MKKLFLLFLAGILMMVSSTVILAATYDSFLTIADVEKVSGLTGIKIVAKDPSKGAGGDLNFATADGKLVMMANFLNVRYFQEYKKQPSYFKAPVAGVGDEAFSGPKRDPQYVLFFRKGNYCVTLSSFFNPEGTSTNPTMLTMNQLIALGKTIAARIK